jgi:hypothetical protein
MKKNLSLLFILIALTAVVAVIWYFKGDEQNVATGPLADFAIEDTSSINKIYIVDANQRSVTLERDPDSRYWDLNGKHKARKDAVDLLLKTFKRIKVKSPVSKEARDNVIKLVAAAGKKVEIYTDADTTKPLKSYIVGTATQDHTGTYMVLERPDKGRSDVPFITHMEGFTGFLSTRFFTDEEEWRYTGVFDYPDLEIEEVTVQHHEAPEQSFTIEYHGGNDIQLRSKLLKQNVPSFDTTAVKDYLLLFKKVHIETFQSHLTSAQEDSLLNTSPAYTLSVLENSGQRKKIDLYHKAPVSTILDENGEPEKWDMARMYGVVSGDDVVLVQLFVFDPLLRGLGSFAPSATLPTSAP